MKVNYSQATPMLQICRTNGLYGVNTIAILVLWCELSVQKWQKAQ